MESVSATRSSREALLDAACELLQTRAWPTLPMLDVARLARTNRSALYVEFGTRASFERSLRNRESGRLRDAIHEALAENRRHPADAFRAGLNVIRTSSSTAPLAALLLSEPGRGIAPPTGLGGPLQTDTTRKLSRTILEVWPVVNHADAVLLGGTLTRMMVSYATLASPRATASAETVALIAAAFVEQRLTEATGTSRG